MRRVISAFFGVLCIAAFLCLPCFASSLGPGDATPEEICREIVTTYREATRRADLNSFSGYCGSFVGYETYLLGIDTTFSPTHGCDVYDKYRKLDMSTGGYGITTYSGKNYSIREALNEICAEGPAYDILLGFQRGSNTADGQKYGHCVFVNAIIDGKVYFSESFAFWIDDVKHKEGEALVCDLDYFCSVYERFTEFEGIIHFASPGSIPAAGQCGDNLKWYYEAGTLKFQGQGAMWDGAPWEHLNRFVRNVEIPEGVTSIGSEAFRGFTRISEVHLPESITVIGAKAFADCPYIAGMNLGKNISRIDSGAFDNCPLLVNLQVEDNPALRQTEGGSLLRVDGSTLVACIACQSGSLAIPDDITAIASGAFRSGLMNSIVIGKNVNEIAPGIFSGCDSLKTIQVAPENPSLREKNGALLSYDGKTLYAYVENSAWAAIPDGVEKVMGFAFASCGRLQEIQISSSVREIAPDAFNDCPSLIRLNVEYGNPSYTVKDGILYTKDLVVLVKAINCAESEYVVPAATVELQRDAFTDCKNLRRIVLPASVQILGEHCVGYNRAGKLENFTILGSYDSPAYDYAALNNIAFSALP